MLNILKRLGRAAPPAPKPETTATLDLTTGSESRRITNEAALIAAGVEFDRVWAGKSPWGRKGAVLFARSQRLYLLENGEVTFHHSEVKA